MKSKTLPMLGVIASLCLCVCAFCKTSVKANTNPQSEKCPKGMAYIPPGKFKMGCSPGYIECSNDEKPDRKVKITKGYCMDTTEVTQSAYQQVMGTNPSKFQDCGGDCPVETVSWDNAKSYCEKVGKRLPTEAEWEYAARGGAKTKYYWGHLIDGDYAWYFDNSGGTAHPVGQKKANVYGLYDMLGNVLEWVRDCYDEKWYEKMPTQDPNNESFGCNLRVLRGGSCENATSLRASDRHSSDPHYTYGLSGFRCAKDF